MELHSELNREIDLVSSDHLAILIVAASVAVLFQPCAGSASQIGYSWSGQILPTADDDPWQIGEHGQAFVLNVAVPSNASDLSDVNVEFAAFTVDYAKLALEGEDIPFSGNGIIDFTDNSLVGYDLLVFSGEFQHFEQSIEIGFAVVLLPETFKFFDKIEPPPYFSSTTNTLGAVCCGGRYATVVAAGAIVTVVPEPASLALLATCGLLVFRTPAARLRRKNSKPTTAATLPLL
jgi:hypothetical protein